MPNLIALLLFPFCPFISFIIACTNLKTKSNGIVFVLFYALFGFCHTFEDTRTDSYRKAIEFKMHFPESFESIIDQYNNGEIMDMYESLLFSFLKNHTNDPHIMLMAVGLITGIFVLCIIRRIMQENIGKNNGYILIIFLLIFLHFAPIHIGGIRNITALSIFTYSSIKFIIDRQNIWIAGILLSPLIHFSFAIYAIVAILIRYIHFSWKVLFWPVIIASIASMFLETSSWANIISEMEIYVENSSITDRAFSYADKETDTMFQESLTTKILSIQNTIQTIVTIIVLFCVRNNIDTLKITCYQQKIFDTMMAFLLLGYIMTSFSVVGSRYLIFGTILLYTFLLAMYVYNRHNKILINCISLLLFSNGANIAWLIYNSYLVTGSEIYYLPLPLILI